MAVSRMPVIFFGHGSPTNALEDNRYTRSWQKLGASVPRPRAILAISAHWCTHGSCVTSMATPRTIHDFGGFVALSKLQYPAPGYPELANEMAQVLAPIPLARDHAWGLDHGTWSVLIHVFAQADVPVVQLSLDVDMTPEQRVDVGCRLQSLRESGVLIMASGNIVHNLGVMQWDEQALPYPWAQKVHDELCSAVRKRDIKALTEFEYRHPMAGFCHPSPEHFWPLLYALGASHPDDQLTIETPEVMFKSLSMASFIWR